MTALVRAGSLRGFRELVSRLGGNPDALLRRHRILPSSLKDEDTLIPVRSLMQLLEACARSLDCPDFGLQLGQSQDISILGPVALVIQHAPTVGEALQCASRYLFVHSPALALTIFPAVEGRPDLAELRYEARLSGLVPGRQANDLTLAVAHRMLKLMLGDRYRPQEVHLPHTPIAPLATYRRYYGAPVKPARPYGALLVPRALLDVPSPAVNATLRELAAHYLDDHYAGPDQAVASRVRIALSRSLGTGRSQMGQIAGVLAMHPRTLQRHLAAEGTSFEAIREDVCQQAALRYLGTTTLSLSQTAALLDLSQQSALTRACRRWFGRTPSAIRRRASAPARP